MKRAERGKEHLLDVSELEAPEPLVQALSAIETLEPGDYLRFRHRMKPCHLYTHLKELGFVADTREWRGTRCEVFIWRQGDSAAQAAAVAAASMLEPWRE